MCLKRNRDRKNVSQRSVLQSRKGIESGLDPFFSVIRGRMEEFNDRKYSLWKIIYGLYRVYYFSKPGFYLFIFFVFFLFPRRRVFTSRSCFIGGESAMHPRSLVRGFTDATPSRNIPSSTCEVLLGGLKQASTMVRRRVVSLGRRRASSVRVRGFR